MNLQNCHFLMAMNSSWMTTRKLEVMELQLKTHVKDQQMITLLLKDLVKSSDHLKNGERTTFCLNMVRNGPMWLYWKLL